MRKAVSLTPWAGEEAPSEETLREAFSSERLTPSGWSNGPGDRYSVHSHSYHKVLYCVRGSITFEVEGKKITLRPGDRLDISPGTRHSAVVGAVGVACLEAAR